MQRRTLVSELLVVLAVSFFASVAYALIRFSFDVGHVASNVPVTVRQVAPEFNGFDFAFGLVNPIVQFAPVALVAHLLARSGETMRRIGFDRTRPRFDAAVGAGLALFGLAAAVSASVVARALDLSVRPIVAVNSDAHWSAIALLVVTSVAAAVSEEVIVNGYAITRLCDVGWTSGWAIAASSGLRASYHLYQGVGGFVANIVSGVVAGAVFVRTKRVMPLVIAHLLIDLAAFTADLFLGRHLGFIHGG